MYKTHARTKHRNGDIDLHDDLQQIKKVLAATARDFKGKTAEIFNQSLENVKDRVKERTTDMQENSADYIAERPFMSVGVALLSGLCLGYLLKSNKRQRRNSHWKD